MPRVTVILPNFNHAAYLTQRVESVLRQTFQDFEIIILDDASTDSSIDVLQTYEAHPKVKAILRNEANSGNTFVQWEKGLRQASGEYIWIAESDDWADPQLLSTLVGKLDGCPEAALAFCASEWVDSENHPIPRTGKRPWKQDFTMDGPTFAKRFLLGYNHICNASAVVFRRNDAVILPAVNDCQAYRASGDRLFWWRLATTGKVCYSAQAMNHFRQHTQKVSGNATSRGQNIAEDHTIYRLAKQAMPLSRLDRRLICGYHYHAIQADNVAAEGKTHALNAWQQETEFGSLSHLLYLLQQALYRIG